MAAQRGFAVLDDHIYSDQAQSGARRDRLGLSAMVAAGQQGHFDIVLVDDLSRLARDNYLMLSVIAELHFEGVRVVSVADGPDSDDEEATLGIQIRGIFNELQLQDLRKKTLRGQIGQKERGFSVGERTFGYRSVPVGTIRMDKKGRPRPDGYRMEIEPREAGVVLRVLTAYADGLAVSRIVRTLNEGGVPGRCRSAKGWSPATVSRLLDNEKYAGRWAWNRTATRRDPRTGKRRRFPKPASESIIHEDDALRIVPPELWDRVRARRKEVGTAWPGGKGRRGFSRDQKGQQRHFPTHLLSGAMRCGLCGASIAQVSGKAGGYYGCLGAAKGACDNRVLVRRKLAERIIVGAVMEQVGRPAQVRYVLERVGAEVARLSEHLPETLRVKEAELGSEERRLTHFVDFIGEGRGSQALAKALLETERRVEALREELEGLWRSRAKVFQVPPLEWIEERLSRVQEVLERRTEQSALLLRTLLGPISLDPIAGDIGRPYYLARSSMDCLALCETPPGAEAPEGGSNSLRQWRRREWAAVGLRPILARLVGGREDLPRADGLLGSNLALRPRAAPESARVRPPPPDLQALVTQKAPTTFSMVRAL